MSDMDGVYVAAVSASSGAVAALVFLLSEDPVLTLVSGMWVAVFALLMEVSKRVVQ